MPYQRKQLSAPRLSGRSLRLFAALVGTPLAAPIRRQTFEQLGVDRLRRTPVADHFAPHDPYLPHPEAKLPGEEPAMMAQSAAGLAAQTAGFAFEGIGDFAKAYRAGEKTPLQVAERVLELVKGHGAELGIFIACDEDDFLSQAKESTERFEAKKSLGIFDGVPMAIKDEVKMRGYPTTAGTSFLGTDPETEDAETVARLRSAGALLIGKANMHEVGLGVTGINPHYGPARNPYDPSRVTGGSSSGSAAAVAAGFGPISLGADGGGSIRIPAGLCGLVGLKATYGRISEHGAIPLCWSVGHLGPIGVTAGDVAAAYGILAGPDPRDRRSLLQPPVHLHDLANQDLQGIRLGICTDWFDDARPEVVDACHALVDKLVDAGVEVREIDVPDIEVAKAAHLVIIISEMLAFNSKFGRERRQDYGLDVRVNFALGGSLTSADYVHAMRHRQSFTHQMLDLMGDVDVVVTPTTATTAVAIPEHALPEGESDIATLEEISRFAAMGNLTGFPAIGVPAGYDEEGLPISCQFLGRPWEEHLLLRLGHVADGLVPRRRPRRYAPLLDGGPSAG